MGFLDVCKSFAKSVKNTITDYIKHPDTRNNEIKVNDIKIIDRFIFDPVDQGDTIELKANAHIQLDITRTAQNIDTKPKKAILDVFFKKGFKTNGASAPEKFRGIIHPYIAMDDEDAHKYNAAAFTHDGLYAWEGVIEEYGMKSVEENKDWHTLTRSECDDILRGVWRESHFVGRFAASAGDLGVMLAAGGPDHWGHDDLKCKPFFSAKIKYLN